MKEHIDAIRALLAGVVTTYYVSVPNTPTYPYVLLWSTSGVPGFEQSVEGPGDLTDNIGATAVAATPDGVLVVRDRVRVLLDGSHPAVAGRLTWLNLYDSLPTTLDTDVTLTGTGHPAYGVDMYRLISTPA